MTEKPEETKYTPFPFSHSTEKSEIEFSKTKTSGLDQEHVFLKVRGKNLEECKKYFDEVKQEMGI